jgi:hypothetical protein
VRAGNRTWSDPEKAARKIVEIANSVEAAQDGRIYIEKINAPILYRERATPAEYKAGLDLAIARGWLVLHESGTFASPRQAPTCSPSGRYGPSALPSVHFYSFAAERNLWLRVCAPKMGVSVPCPRTATTLAKQQRRCSKWQRQPSDPAVAAGLIEAAANLKDQAGELPPQVSIKAPDVQPEGEPPEGAG